jgi:hypothetical protein
MESAAANMTVIPKIDSAEKGCKLQAVPTTLQFDKSWPDVVSC